MIIDPPTPFAPLADWQEYLAELRRIKPKTDQVRAAIDEAEAVIAEKTAQA
jgi:hypothetical protein